MPCQNRIDYKRIEKVIHYINDHHMKVLGLNKKITQNVDLTPDIAMRH